MTRHYHGLTAGLFLAILTIVSCSESPTTLSESTREELGVATEFDLLASEYLGTSLGREFRQREFASHSGWRSPGQGRYPLQLGNRWRYRRMVALQTTLTGEEPTLETFRARVFDELIGTEQRFGRSYVVQERVYDEGEFGLTTQWVRLRQDRQGLYEADVETSEPPILDGAVARQSRDGIAASPGSVRNRFASTLASTSSASEAAALESAFELVARKLDLLQQVRDCLAEHATKEALHNELTRLSYPLQPGKSWVIREAPHVSFTVEGLQVLRLRCGVFPAWRLRLDAEYFGPDDRAVFWYGRVGFLGLAAEFEADAVDEDGNVVGVVSGHEREVLTKFELQRHGRHTASGN